MGRLRDIVIGGAFHYADGGGYRFVEDFPARYIADLTRRPKLSRPLKVVAACGNGTAGAFAPQILSRLAARFFPLDCELDFTFPRYNPNPEDLQHAACDGRGGARLRRRCRAGLRRRRRSLRRRRQRGVGDFRRQDRRHAGARPFAASSQCDLRRRRQIDGPVRHRSRADRQRRESRLLEDRPFPYQAARARPQRPGGFEKSGHFFFNAPIGRGYDDGFVTAIAVLDMLDRNPTRSMADLYRALPRTFGSPTMSPHCADEVKYAVAERVVARFKDMQAKGALLTGQAIRDVTTVNGVRVTVADGTWGLVRASSNKPELVVVVESPVSEARMREMFAAVDGVLRENEEVGAYNQTI
jgi:phosphomannomutase/phosphoglucomutase